MKQTAILVTVFAVLLSGAYGNNLLDATYLAHSRLLQSIPDLDSVYAACQTKASTSLVLIGPGSGNVKASASCEAFAASISTITTIIEEYIQKIHDAPINTCSVAQAKEVISACAQSIAKVYTEARAEINLQGNNIEACASASSQGDAYAKAYAALLVNLWIGITDGKNSAEADAQVKTLNYALSKAWAAAKAEVCQYGTGNAADFEKSIAEQCQTAITCVTVEVAAKLCNAAIEGYAEAGTCGTCGGGDLEAELAKTESTSEIGVCTSTYEDSLTIGNAAVGSKEQPDLCSGSKAECCDSYYDNASECLCGRDCKLNKNAVGLWEDSTGKGCFCESDIPPELGVTPTTPKSTPPPSKPVPAEPVPTEPVPTEPVPTEPVPTEPVPTEPVPTENPVPSSPVPEPTSPSTPSAGYATPYESKGGSTAYSGGDSGVTVSTKPAPPITTTCDTCGH